MHFDKTKFEKNKFDKINPQKSINDSLEMLSSYKKINKKSLYRILEIIMDSLNVKLVKYTAKEVN